MTKPAPDVGENPVVGHKTMHSAERGYWHEPLHQSEADELRRSLEERDKARAELMPDEQTAIRMFFDAWLRLQDMGWQEAIYCPKDGKEFLGIEPGSTGIHHYVYHGKWPQGSYWSLAGGDMWPGAPCLWKPKEK